MARLDLNIGVVGVDAATRALSNFTSQLGALNSKFSDTKRRFNEANQTAKDFEKELRNLSSQLKSGAISQDTFDKETKEVRDALASARQAANGFQAQLNSLSATIKQTTAEENANANATKNLKGYHDSFSTGIRSTNSVSVEFSRTLGLLSPALSRYGYILSAVSAANGTGALSFANLGVAASGALSRIGAFVATPIGATVTALGALFVLIKSNKDTVLEFNNGLIDTGKTAGLTGKQLNEFGDAVIRLSGDLKVVNTKSILEYTIAAGQLGIKGTRSILDFGQALSKLQVASDIAGQEGARNIARLLNITDGGTQNIKAFGDEIVRLGINSAATESEILRNATLIAQNTGLYKIGREEVLAYASSTKAVGLSAEVVGSAFGRVLAIFEKSIRTGQGLNEILRVTGISSQEIGKQFNENASGVFQRFIEGLNSISAAGGSVQATLDELGIKAIRDRRVIATLATEGYGELKNALDQVAQASGTLDQVFEQNSQKLSLQIERISVAWQNLVLTVENGEGIIGSTVAHLADGFATVLEAIQKVTTSTSWSEFWTRLTDYKKADVIRNINLGGNDLVSALNNANAVNLSKANGKQIKEVYDELAAAYQEAAKQYDIYQVKAGSGALTQDGLRNLQQYKALLDVSGSKLGQLKIQLDSPDVKRQIADAEEEALDSIAAIQARLSELRKLPGSAIKGSPVFNEIKELQARLKELNGTRTQVKIEADPGSFKALQKQLSDLQNRSDSSVIGSDTFKQIQALEKRIKVLGEAMKNPVTLSDMLKKNFEDSVKALDKVDFSKLKLPNLNVTIDDAIKSISADLNLGPNPFGGTQGGGTFNSSGTITDIVRQAHDWNKAISDGIAADKKRAKDSGNDYYQAFSRGVDKFATDFYDTLTTLNEQTKDGLKGVFSSIIGGFSTSFNQAILGSLSSSLTSGLSKSFEGIFSNAKQAGAEITSSGKSLSKSGTQTANAISAGASLLGGILSGAFKPTDSAGQALGGGLSGAGTGALIGSAIAPGIGTAIGAVAGGLFGAIGGIFGASSARKREREVQEQQLAELKKQTELQRQSALAFASSIVGQQTTSGIITGVDRDAFGEVFFEVEGRKLKAVIDRETVAQDRGL